jgi:dTDP-4-amino-4,6-dideoxygalactose transaminase
MPLRFRQPQKPIFISLSPNTERDDIWLALKLLFQPWKYKKAENGYRCIEKEFRKYLGVRYAFSFNSGRSAFLAILNALDFELKSEVLLQAFTCNAAVNPIIWSGLKPVFVDIERETLNIDPKDLERKITQKSKAVLVQHTFGLPSKLDEIQEICQKYNLVLIEDCAHSLGAQYHNQKVGTLGRVAFFSFGRDKVISSIYGGMAVTNDPVLAEKIKDFQEKCPLPSLFWVFQQLLHPILTNYFVMPLYGFFGAGKWLLLFLQKIKILSKAVQKAEKKGKKPGFFPKKMPQALAILALNQLRKLDRFNKHRQKIANFYYQELKNSAFILPQKDFGRIYMRYSVLVENKETDEILTKARGRKIFLDDGWRKTPIVPPDTSQEKMQYLWGSSPKAENLAKKILNLPTHINVSLKEAKRIVEFLKSLP